MRRILFQVTGGFFRVLLPCLSVVLVLSMGLSASAKDEASDPLRPAPATYGELAQSLERTASLERESLEEIEDQLLKTRDLEKHLDVELSTFKIQASTHGALLQLSTTQPEELEEALEITRRSLDLLALRSKELVQKRTVVEQLRGKAAEQAALNEKQLMELQAEGSDDPEARPLIHRFSVLSGLLSRKQAVLDEILAVYTKQIQEREKLKETLSVLSASLEEELNRKKKQRLFLRSGTAWGGLSGSQIQEDAKRLLEQVRPVFTAGFWSEKMRFLWNAGGILWIMLSILFVILQGLIFGLRRFCTLAAQKPKAKAHPWGCLTLRLFQQSLPLLGTLLFVYLYAKVRHVYAGSSFLHVTVDILSIWLFTHWGLRLLNVLSEENSASLEMWTPGSFRFLLIGVRVFAVAIVLLQAMQDNTGALSLLARGVLEIGLLVWCFLYWRNIERKIPKEGLPAPVGKEPSRLRTVLKGTTYVVALGGVLLELGGYGPLALYWFASWGRTLIVLLWATLLLLSLREWEQVFKQEAAIEPEVSTGTKRPLLWLAIRLCWLAWVGVLMISLFISWGAGQIFLGKFLSALNRSFAIGGLQLRPISFVYALLILLFTHTSVRLWRYVLQRKILASSGMEPGLRESIVTISVYLFWALGILLSLGAMGVSTTSITVGFGALGIGIGFGLQNIFSNFISGIILLFERPIQPGDAVEINNVWGIVRKINVRSTVVQTWDNASLIIPNSEFISHQVTNWSFKDLTLRRSVVVGVAYGSDIELVRKTLLEIAAANPLVRKRPEPDVLFSDFGDSALVFKLRVWTTIQMMLVVETQIRFEIDRLFRERDITIAFPQRDVHVRTVAQGEPADVSRKASKPADRDGEDGTE